MRLVMILYSPPHMKERTIGQSTWWLGDETKNQLLFPDSTFIVSVWRETVGTTLRVISDGALNYRIVAIATGGKKEDRQRFLDALSPYVHLRH